MEPDPPSLLIISLLSSGTIFSVVGLLILLVFSALISGSEVAFFSLSSTQLSEDGEYFTNKDIVSKLLVNHKKLLATILIANNFINIAIVLLFAALGEIFFGEINYILFDFINLRFVLEVIVVTFLILLFGEILPKVYASRNNTKFAGFMAKPLAFLFKILHIFSTPMQAGTDYIENRLGKTKSNLSVDELSQALQLTSESETTDDEQKMLQGIVAFGNTDTKQVMRPRIDVFALEIEESYSKVITLIIKSGYSRIPVYEDSLDTVKGILYVKDLLPHLEKKTYKWQDLIRKPIFVSEHKKLDDLLKDFQLKKVHLAIVVDEYGGTSGIVTLEDVIEEIVGDINDEFDAEDLNYTKLDAYNYVFEGKTSLKDLYRVVDIDVDLFEEHKGEAETIAGFILEISGKFPKKNTRVTFDNYVFTIEGLDKKRIKQVKLTIPKE